MTQFVLRDRQFGDAYSAQDVQRKSVRSTSTTAKPGNLPIQLELVTSFKDFEHLEADWNTLYNEVAGPGQAFQSFNWCWHWCRHYLGDGLKGPKLAVVCGRINGRLTLVMPLLTQRTAGLTELSWLGEPVSQYGDAVASPDAATPEMLALAWQFALSETAADVANLRRVRSDACIKPLMSGRDSHVTATTEAPFLRLADDASYESWETRRQPRARKNRRRQARRLADQGEVSFAAVSSGEEAAILAGHAVRLKRETLDEKGAISPALADARFERFFADAAHGHGRPAGVTVLTMLCGGLPIALKILIENKHAAYLHVAVFEPGFERCGPGALLLEHLVDRTIRARRDVLDLLPPRHEYKADFADSTTTVSDYAFPVTTKGWLYTHGFLRLRRQIKAGIETMPKPLRRFIGRMAEKRFRPASA